VCIMLKEVAAIDNLPEVIKVPDWPLEQFFQDSYSADAGGGVQNCVRLLKAGNRTPRNQWLFLAPPAGSDPTQSREAHEMVALL